MDKDKISLLKKLLPNTNIIINNAYQYIDSDYPIYWHDHFSGYSHSLSNDQSKKRPIEGNNKDSFLFNFFKEKIITNMDKDTREAYKSWEDLRDRIE